MARTASRFGFGDVADARKHKTDGNGSQHSRLSVCMQWWRINLSLLRQRSVISLRKDTASGVAGGFHSRSTLPAYEAK